MRSPRGEMISSPHGRLAPSGGANLQVNKLQQQQPGGHLQQTPVKRFLDNGHQVGRLLTAAASDGLEGSYSSSSGGSISDTICLHPKQQQQQQQVSDSQNSQQFVSSDGFIFSLGSAASHQRDLDNAISSRQAHHNSNYALDTSDLMANDSSSSPNSSSTTNLEPPDQRRLLPSSGNSSRESLSQQQQQHRRLQYQVHQQLQRIYGNQSDRKQQQQPPPPPPHTQMFVQNQPTERQKFLMKRHQVQQAKRFNETQSYNLMHDTDRNHQHHNSANNYQNQQQSMPPSRFNGSKCAQIHHNQLPDPHNPQQEQTYDSLSPSDHMNRGEQEDFYDINGNLPQPARRRMNTSIGPIQEKCDHGDEEEDSDLLLPEAVRQPVTPRRPVIDRKSQLESLHYATVTAAALLSATANAAAAFVATEKQFDTRQQQQPAPAIVAPPPRRPLEPAPRPKRVASNAIYSDAYQYIQRKPRCQKEPYQSIATPRVRPPQQNLYKTPIYADAAEPQANPQIKLHPGNQIYHQLARLHQSQQLQLQQQQLQMQNVQKYQQIPPTNFNNQQPLPQGPISNINRMLMNHRQLGHPFGNIHQQNHLLRLQQQNQLNQLIQHRAMQQRLAAAASSAQQQQQSTSQQVPALAILHQPGNKNGPELLGKVMITSPLAVANPQPVPNAVELARYAQAKAVLNARKMNQLMASGSNNGGQSNPISRNFGPPASIGSMAALSDSSGASHVPFDLERAKLRPLGCIERICRINLTMFWWGLLLVSCAFVGAAISIYRYII